MMEPDLEQAIERYHQALTALIKGNAAHQKGQFSHRDDVCLANPFGPPVRGWERVERTLDQVASLYINAGPKAFERLVMNVATDLACIVEIERAQVTVRGRHVAGQVLLCVTTLFRLEAGEWKVVHRHANSITTPRPPETVVQP